MHLFPSRQRGSRPWQPWAGALAVLCLFLHAACGPQSPTALLLVADSDIPELDQVTFEVDFPEQDEMRTAEASLADGPPPRSLTLHHTGGPLGPIAVRVVGKSRDTEVIRREATLYFVPNQTLAVELHLVRACQGAGCEDGLVCSHQGCRSRTVSRAELVPYEGAVPSLDGGAAEGMEDSGAPADAQPPEQDAGSDPPQPTDAGMPDDPPPPQDASTEPTPDAGEPDPCEGQMCGDLPCVNGRCVLTCEAGRMCEGTCPEGRSCGLDCTAGGDCMGTCARGSDCLVRCRGAESCDTLCQSGANCTAVCATGDCRMLCRANATCGIDCRNQPCDEVHCQQDAECLMRCPAGEPCTFATCPGGAASCGNNVVACNAPCPD